MRFLLALVCVASLARPGVASAQAHQSPGAEPPSEPRSPAARFLLINDSRQTIDNLNLSPVDSDEWGDDLLGTLALPPHSRIIAGPLEEGCVFDVRVVYHDRKEEVLRRQNLCQLQQLSFTGRHARLPHSRMASKE